VITNIKELLLVHGLSLQVHREETVKKGKLMPEYYVNGKKVVLTNKDFVAKGGEKSVFRKGKIAYAIYEELKKMIPPAKIGELSELDNPGIVRPQDIIYNEQKHEIGFTMAFLDDNVIPLPKLFTNTFRDKNGINNDMTTELVENLKHIIHFVHEHKCLIVDGNEMNYLVGNDFLTPHMIDVNSFQTKSYPATAYHPATRDWMNDGFTTLSDWFGFAVISFQLFVGIHPFKGKHPDYRRNDFRKRIADCISVFDSSVSLPPAARDFNLIPSMYKDWYFDLFVNGMRKVPPQLPGSAGQVHVQVVLVQSTDNFEIQELREFADTILYHSGDITKIKGKILIGRTDYNAEPNEEILLTPLEEVPVIAKVQDRKLNLRTITPSISVKYPTIECTDMMIIENTLYLKNKEKLVELGFRVLNSIVHPFIKTVWSIEPNSSKLFSGMVTQSVLGKGFVVIPLPDYTKSSCIVKSIPEIDDYQIVDAKHDNRICMLIGSKGTKYDRIILVFDEAYNKYRCVITEDVDFAPVNFVVLDTGICIHLADDDAIEILFNKPGKGDLKRIEDPQVDSSMRLCKDGTKVLFFKGTKLFSFKMK